MLEKIKLPPLGVWFWTHYALIYDVLLRLRPYTAMLDEIVDGLGLERAELVLDAGCGSGNLTRRLLNRGYRVHAVDSSPGMLQRAAAKCPEADPQTQNLDQSLPCAQGTYAGITCSNVLYSLPNPRKTLVDFHRILKPGGCLIISNPGRQFSMRKVLERHWQDQKWSGRLQFLAQVPGLLLLTAFNLILLRRQQADRFFFPGAEQLRQLFQETGFEKVEVRSTYAGQGWLVSARKPESRFGRGLS
ncbi:MAG: class I SAM-dependent methyltransferase [Candidatus Eremiobacteraeota bacterium]|nr:class I SAM-dependent methyltransferase [Candidatus Eremiobacteraeota bacterium]MCW5867180.1 class I SAM-dependent methyltransferase [Candidatus Eremiobacteraeota bacterium]